MKIYLLNGCDILNRGVIDLYRYHLNITQYQKFQMSYHSSLTYISQELELAPTCTIQYITVCRYDNSPDHVSY